MTDRLRRIGVALCGGVLVASCSSASVGRPSSARTDVRQSPSSTTVTHPLDPVFTAPLQREPVVPAQFVDVTAQAGLGGAVQAARRRAPHCLLNADRLAREFPHQPRVTASSWTKEQCVPERMTGGVAVADYDGDGWPDIYVTRLDGPGILYRNMHNGTFADVTKAAGLDVLDEASDGAVWADVDNDGRPDLYVTTFASHRYWFFHNDGNGHFTEQAAARGLALDDGTVHLGYSVNAGDFNGDGYLDFEVSEWRPTEVARNMQPSHTRLLMNLGRRDPGHFVDVTNRAGVALETPTFATVSFASAFADLDDDGRPDLVMANDFSTSRLFWNDGNGHFTNGTRDAGVGTDENGMGLTIGDYNGDGRPDVFVSAIYDHHQCPVGQCAHGTSGNRLYRNLGGRHFVDATSAAGVREGGWGWGAAFVDVANEGRLDLVQASGVDFPWEPTAAQYGTGGMFLWRNRGDGTFAPSSAVASGLTTPGVSKGLAVLDYDRDGRMDVLVARDGGAPVLYRNVTPHSGHWLDVQLVGTRSNRDALGAVVDVRAGDRWQRIEYGSVSHFLGQSENQAHFGLGDAPFADEVRIRWPSGHVQHLGRLSVDRTVLITEPR